MCFGVFFFFFKQKTAYEMRISDWSSDVCSSDLIVDANGLIEEELQKGSRAPGWALELAAHIADARDDREAAVRHLSTLCARRTATPAARQIGRASCRKRVGQSV